MIVPRKQQIQDMLYDMATMSMHEIATLIVDLQLEILELKETKERLATLGLEFDELLESHKDLNQHYSTLVSDHGETIKELEQAQHQRDQATALVRLTNYGATP